METIIKTVTGIGAALTLATVTSAQAVPAMVRQPPMPSPSAIAEIQAKAAEGDMEAEYQLGLAYDEGREVPCDRLVALDWYKKAAGQGHKPAQSAVQRVADDYAKFADLRARAEAGDAQAQYDFSMDMYNSGRCFGESNYLKWQRLSADNGNVQGEVATGNYYLAGYKLDLKPHKAPRPVWASDDGDQNLPEAMMWYAKAAAHDDLGAEYILSGLYALDTPFRDLGRMEYWLQKIAYRDGRAYFQPGGDGYLTGKVFLDAQQALCRYYNGQGIYRPVVNDDYSLMVRFGSQPDYVKLRVCYTKVSQGINEPDAFVGLGDLYAEGLGGGVDKVKARENYMSAVNGNWIGFDYQKPFVMAKLGELYARQRDDAHAYFWLKLMSEYRPYNDSTWTTDRYDDTIHKSIDKGKRTFAAVKARLAPIAERKQDAATIKWMETHWPEIPLPPTP